jgi:hypothetical protein
VTAYRLVIPSGATRPRHGAWFVLHDLIGRPSDQPHDLNDLVGLDGPTVLVTRTADGVVTLDDGAPGAPHFPDELVAITDGEGYRTADTDPDLHRQARAAGWELVTGYTGQYGYAGPVFHSSEYIGGGLADLIAAADDEDVPSRVWWAVGVVSSPDADEPAGWVLAYRDADS